jgi:hypothetical protein
VTSVGSLQGDQCTGCGSCGVLTTVAGTFTDGSGGSDYPDNANCKWSISPRGAAWVRLVFMEFNTESVHDKVVVFQCADASCQAPTKLAELSGTYSTGQVITSTTPHVVVWFVSDSSGTSAGFTATWSTNVPTPPVGRLKFHVLCVWQCICSALAQSLHTAATTVMVFFQCCSV